MNSYEYSAHFVYACSKVNGKAIDLKSQIRSGCQRHSAGFCTCLAFRDFRHRIFALLLFPLHPTFVEEAHTPSPRKRMTFLPFWQIQTARQIRPSVFLLYGVETSVEVDLRWSPNAITRPKALSPVNVLVCSFWATVGTWRCIMMDSVEEDTLLRYKGLILS